MFELIKNNYFIAEHTHSLLYAGISATIGFLYLSSHILVDHWIIDPIALNRTVDSIIPDTSFFGDSTKEPKKYYYCNYPRRKTAEFYEMTTDLYSVTSYKTDCFSKCRQILQDASRYTLPSRIYSKMYNSFYEKHLGSRVRVSDALTTKTRNFTFVLAITAMVAAPALAYGIHNIKFG